MAKTRTPASSFASPGSTSTPSSRAESHVESYPPGRPAMQPTFPPLPPAPPAGPPGEAPPPFGRAPDPRLGPGGPGGPVVPRPPRETKAAASLALGVLSVAGAMCGVGLSLGLPAIVLGALAHRDIRRSGGVATGGGLATAGIFLGSMGSVLFVAWIAVVALAML